jgi:hypothetical protein
MRRLALTAGLLAFVALPSSVEARGAKRYLKKESTVDMSGSKAVFFGWVDLVSDDWSVHGYSDREEWDSAINRLNNAFQRLAQTKWLAGRTVTGAKGLRDASAEGKDLYITFSDVRVDYDNYLLHLSIHFVDPKTRAEIATVPLRPYYGNDWGFEKYLRAALEEVNLKIQVEVTGVASEK